MSHMKNILKLYNHFVNIPKLDSSGTCVIIDKFRVLWKTLTWLDKLQIKQHVHGMFYNFISMCITVGCNYSSLSYFNHVLIKLVMNLGPGWVIISDKGLMMQLRIHGLILVKSEYKFALVIRDWVLSYSVCFNLPIDLCIKWQSLFFFRWTYCSYTFRHSS